MLKMPKAEVDFFSPFLCKSGFEKNLFGNKMTHVLATSHNTSLFLFHREINDPDQL